MAAVDVRTPAGKAAGSVELPAEIFDVQVNVPLIHQVVVAQLAAARQGTHATKTRAQVSGGGKKPYKQKGTGRARQGDVKSPIYVGGGTVFGPHPRDYSYAMPKKAKRLAMKSILSLKAQNSSMKVVEDFTVETGKTKDLAAVLKNLLPQDKA